MIITAGIYKGHKITAPDEKITRPTLSKVRMGVFNTLYSIIGDFNELSFLDLFGGSGIMGLEALSRGFKEVTVFEINKKSAEIIKKNYASLKIKPDLYIGDSTKLIEKIDKKYDIVYVDPPYNSDLYTKILPKVNHNIIIVEHSQLIEFDKFQIIKQKKYGDSYISFLKQIN